ncbi:hypothetical protein THSYN_30735 (plasmid) [Candidatus Thiodictyon syntrophicum]|uniref:Uncharacterized protein n=1 Tax=Candidatus Thiodictyon syntrophicum TaxID=1166950 RepID=A0A2K8UI75_9GAMM|nr:hypothetical protein THSYN_30735 [Candidatus Thiodictyon syntrophicum]
MRVLLTEVTGWAGIARGAWIRVPAPRCRRVDKRSAVHQRRLRPNCRIADRGRTWASIIAPATAVCRSAFRPTDWERRTPVRPALSAARKAAVASEIAPHWGAALPMAGIMIEARTWHSRRRMTIIAPRCDRTMNPSVALG